MKYTIVHECCGFEEEVQIYGKASERDAKAKRLAKRPCIHCRAKAARDGGITEGSDKQVAWAASIKRKMLATMDDVPQVGDYDRKAVELIKGWINGHHDARWFIDNEERSIFAMRICALIPEDEMLEMRRAAGYGEVD